MSHSLVALQYDDRSNGLMAFFVYMSIYYINVYMESYKLHDF